MHDLKYASRWNRFLARLIDAVLIGLIGYAINYTMLVYGGDYRALIAYLLIFLLNLAYFVILQAYLGGQTFGKKLMKIRIVTWEGKKPTLGRMFIRDLFGSAACYFTYGIGYLMILWDRKRQGLHDKIADTYVVQVSR